MSDCRVCDAGPAGQRLHMCPNSSYYIPGSGPSAEVFKMPSVWSDELGLPDVGPVWKDYPISKAEFLARQVRYAAPAVQGGEQP